MRQLWTILRREYLERVRQRWFIIGTVLGPVFMLGITVVPGYLGSRSTGRSIILACIDQTGAMEQRLETALSDTLPDGSRRYTLAWEQAPADTVAARMQIDRLRERVLEGEFTGILWLPPDALDGGDARLYAQGLADPEILGRIREAINRTAMVHRLAQRGVTIDDTEAISRDIRFRSFKVTKDGMREGGFATDIIAGFVLALILYMTLLIYGVSIQRSVLEDKNSRIVEILLTSVRPLPIMLGKILGVGSVGLTQYAIWSLVAIAGTAYIRATSPVLANMTAIPPLSLVFFVVYFLLGYFLYAGLFAAVGAMVTNDQEAQQLNWPVSLLLVVPMLLLQMILRDPDSTASVVLSLVPFFSPVLMLMRINLHTPPAWQLALSVGILLVSVLAVAAIAGRIFRIGILVYGKRPTLPEILRWVRES